MNPLVRICCALVMLGAACIAAAQTPFPVPGKVLRVIVPYAPGGSSDIVGRVYADGLRRQFPGATVVVENKGGAGTALAMEELARADKDGHALLLGGNYTTSALPHLRKVLPFDVSRDFVVVGDFAATPLVLVARASLAVDNVTQLVALAKSNPGTVTFGSSGNGNLFHLAGELFSSRAGIKMIHVPYKGSAPTLNDLAGGQLDIAFDTPFTVAAMAQAGKVKLLGITDDKRSPQMPGLATFAEQGVTDFRLENRWIILAQSGTPRDVQQKLHEATRRIASDPAVAASLAKLEIKPATCGSLAECATKWQADQRSVFSMVHLAGIQAE